MIIKRSPIEAKAKKISLDKRSIYLRQMIVNALEKAGRGHIGGAMSLVEILRVLYDDILHFQSDNPNWEKRDRLILSKGHGCLALYAILADKGFFPLSNLENCFRKGSCLGGHPELGKVAGVEASTGSLGHGLSLGIGMALAFNIKERKNRIFVILGDGELNEGSVWEAALCAKKYKLSNLAVIIDRNRMQSCGSTQEILDLEPLAEKLRSFGFQVKEVNGHDVAALKKLFKKLPFSDTCPSAIICHTVKGKGFDFAEDDAKWHYTKVDKEAVIKMRTALEAK